MTAGAEVLLCPEWVVPVVPRGSVLTDTAVAIGGGRILALGAVDDLQAEYGPAERLDLPGQVLMPGLVNAHAHGPMSLLRGIGDDMPLKPWLETRIWPVEAAFVDPQFVADGTELAIAEMLRGGITMVNDGYFFPDVVAKTAIRLGYRIAVGLVIIEFPSAWAASADEYFSRGLALHDALRGEPLVTTTLAPHAPYTVSDDSFRRVHTLSDQLNIKVHLHLHETAGEVAQSRSEHGLRPLARMQRLGLVNENLMAVHMTQLQPAEIQLCASHGVSVLHCPESNLKLGSGICPAEALRQAGVTVALGTDGAASNNDLDLFGEMRTAALIGKHAADDPAAMPAAAVLEMATLNGARALGMDDRIGSIEAGKRADLVSVALDSIESQPLYDVVSQLVYAVSRNQVRHVWIDGQQLVRNGDCTRINTGDLRQRVAHWQQRITQSLH